MKPVCVITGGGSGMGLATAKILGASYKIVISGRTQSKLDGALAELTEAGIDASAMVCDVTDWTSVKLLAETASSSGSVAVVIHAAGVAPHMADSEEILRINAIGTMHVHNAFYTHLVEEGCLIDVGSLAGHQIPSFVVPTRAYLSSRNDPERFLQKAIARTRWFPAKLRSGVAYSISKHFLMWLVRTEAERFARKGVRVLSVSPGCFDTEMGLQANVDQVIKFCAIRRYGRVEEIAQLLALCTDRNLGYLTGVDILCDGGCRAGCLNDPMGFLRMQLEFARG